MDLEKTTETLQRLFGSYPAFWCVAGGWAIDLYLGRQTQEHEDLEVTVLRDDHLELHSQISGLHPQKILTSGATPFFVPWDGEKLELDVIQLRLDPQHGKDFDVLLTPSEKGQWICRRDPTIRLPLEQARACSATGIPVLRPEIVLLFKAKYVREKDTHDLSVVLPSLGPEARSWLKMGLARIHPSHAWLDSL